MAKDYVCTIASGLEQFFRQNNDTRFYVYCSDIDGFDMNTYIEALAWVDIKGKKEVRRDAWKTLVQKNNKKYLNMKNILILARKIVNRISVISIIIFTFIACSTIKPKENATFIMIDSRSDNSEKIIRDYGTKFNKDFKYIPWKYNVNGGYTFFHQPYKYAIHPVFEIELPEHIIFLKKISFLKKHHIITPDTLEKLYKEDEVAIDKAVKLYYKENPNIIVEPIESIRGYDAINRKLAYRPIYIIDKADFKGNKINLVEVKWQAWEFE